MKQDEACVVLCRKVHKKSEIEMFKTMINQEYRVHWLLDSLPVAVRNDELGYVSRGYPVGFVTSTTKSKKPQHFLFNHVRIIVRYSEEEEEFSGARIVGFEVIPFSIKVKQSTITSHPHLVNTATGSLVSCSAHLPYCANRCTFRVVAICALTIPPTALSLISLPLHLSLHLCFLF